MIDRKRLTDQLALHEGFRAKPYRCTAGRLTVGFGRNLDDVGITEDEARYLLQSDISRAEQQANTLDWFKRLDPVRQNAVVELIFNMGFANFPTQWTQTPKALANGAYSHAASLLRSSKWYSQVGPTRGERICRMIESGQWPQ